jgi:small Trp-rich protein
MGFLIVGVLMGLLYLAGIEPVAQWHWGWILLPFALAAMWWTFIDATGISKKRAMKKMEDRKTERRQKAMESLGLTMKASDRKQAIERARAPVVDPIERQRAAKRQENKKVILDSVLETRHSSQFPDPASAKREPKP